MLGQSGPSVLVVDDDAGCRMAVSAILNSGGYATVEATTGEEALEFATREAPSLVVLDICLPGISGYQVCDALRDRFADGLPIIFVSGVRTEAFDRVAGLLIGADDYLEKPFAPDELLIRTRRLIRRSNQISPAVTSVLTRREREIFSLLATELHVREIAEQLFLSPKTVGTHVENIFRKLGVHSRAQAVALAYTSELQTSVRPFESSYN